MNWKQKICLWIGIAVIVLMGLFPPWVFQVKSTYVNELVDAGYAFITNPPHYLFRGDIKIGASIELARLAVQWAIVAVITGGLIVTLADKKDKKPKEEQKE